MSETYTLKAKSSSGDYYEVEFGFDGALMSVSCVCIAGGFNQMCKHKDAFLNNDVTMLFDDSEAATLESIYQLICQSNFPKEFDLYQKALDDIEQQKKELAKQSKIIKGIFGRRLAEGL